ncbi:hypothetical protein AOLI_G00256630 [Acnodon oligacanthus]
MKEKKCWMEREISGSDELNGREEEEELRNVLAVEKEAGPEAAISVQRGLLDYPCLMGVKKLPVAENPLSLLPVLRGCAMLQLTERVKAVRPPPGH